jgi:prepilin-type N-terminal cleavage/methylation domain-containing protein/prepilin-type processing-associated H-X9-DG protein
MKQRGFTLIELLIVIGIIAVLAAILFPVFARARNKAHQSTCASNLRQQGQAITMWATDHEETFPTSATIWQNIALEEKLLTCPGNNSHTTSYIYNVFLSDRPTAEIESPDEYVLTGDGSTAPASFNCIDDITWVDAASWQGTFARLTPALGNQRGAYWYTQPVDPFGGFMSSFDFQITGRGGAGGGADGFTFTIQNNAKDAIGPMGGGLAYDQMPNCLTVEFDTYQNGGAPTNDPNNNHLAVNAAENGGANSCSHTSPQALWINSAIPNISDGLMHRADIIYFGGKLHIDIDRRMYLEMPLKLDKYVKGGSAWIGYTATTGGGWENNDFYSWSFIPAKIPANLNYRHGNEKAQAVFCDGHVGILNLKAR